jgi:rhodanese-related sulfurtransferase
VARILRKRGFEAYALHGGLDAWRASGAPVEAGESATASLAT